MIKLGSLIFETAKNKKAILFAGPAGAGKTTIIRNYIPSNFKEFIINPDKYFEPELEKIGGGSMKQSEFSPEQLSQASKVMSKAQKQAKEDFEDSKLRGRPIIMDITGGSKNETTKKKNILEAEGYDVMMIMVYSSPLTTLKRNQLRNRTLKPSIVLRSWKDVVSNINHYKSTFGEKHFALVDNDDPEDKSEHFSAERAEQYFRTNPNYKELSPEKKEVMTREINSIIDSLSDIDFLAFDELDTKIKNFLGER